VSGRWHVLGSYRFVTRFVLTCRPEQVLDAVLDPEAWLATVRHVHHLERIADGDERGVGRRYTTAVGTSPYSLRWQMEAVEVVPAVRIAWLATGDLAGRGTWTLTAVAPGTLVTSRWQVQTTRPWMRWLAPIARPLFVRNHDRVMRAGAERLADHLDVELVSFACEERRRTVRTAGDGATGSPDYPLGGGR
jgi:hypothetical protein